MNIKNDIFKKAYLESLISENVETEKKDITSPDPEKVPNNGNPIDDLTKENITTIDEDTDDKTETAKDQNSTEETKKEVDVEIQNEEGEGEEEESEFPEDEDGWPASISEEESMSYLMQAMEDFVYELKNCTRGAYTNCKTKEELKDYMTGELAEMLQEAAENL